MDGGLWHCTGDRDQDHPQGKEMQKGKMVVWGGLTNSCEKKRNNKQRRKGRLQWLPKWGVEEGVMGSCDEKGSENERSRKDSSLPTETFYFIFGARCPWESGSMTPIGDKCLYPPVHSSCFCRGNRTSASQEGASLCSPLLLLEKKQFIWLLCLGKVNEHV